MWTNPSASALYADDLDNDTLTYSASGLPDGLAIDDETGEISRAQRTRPMSTR